MRTFLIQRADGEWDRIEADYLTDTPCSVNFTKVVKQDKIMTEAVVVKAYNNNYWLTIEEIDGTDILVRVRRDR